MANVLRAPFWVPRPSDDFIAPILLNPNSVPTALYTFQRSNNLTRAPVRVWRADDPPVWSGSPLASDILVPILTAGGRPPQKKWSPSLTYDDAAFALLAQPPNNNSWIVTYGVSPAPFKPFFRWYFNYDDASVWSGQPLASDILVPILTAGGQPPQKKWPQSVTYDDASFWMGQPVASDTLVPLLTAGGKPTTKQWHYDVDDQPTWQSTTQRNTSALQVQPKPFVPFWRWSYNLDDPAIWSPTPENLNSGIIQNLTQSPQPHTKQWHWDVDDLPPWQMSTDWRNSATIQILTSSGQAPTKRWQWFPDDGDPWLMNLEFRTSPILGELEYRPTAPTKQWHYDTDDLPAWQPLLQINIPLTAVTPTPFFTKQWIYNFDDASVWLAKSLSSGIIQSLTQEPQFPTKQWHYDTDDLPAWQSTIQRNSNVLSITLEPFLAPRFRFGLDDPDPWQMSVEFRGSPVIQSLTQSPQPHTKQWRWDFDEGGLTPGAPTRSEIIPLLTQQPIFGAGGQVPTKQWHYDQDDATVWQQTIRLNLPIQAIEARPFFVLRQFLADDAAIWQPTVVKNLTIGVGPAPAFPNFREFGREAETAWQFETPLNLILLTTPVGHPFLNQLYALGSWANYDSAETFWEFVPPRAWAPILPPAPPPGHVFEWIIRARRRNRR